MTMRLNLRMALSALVTFVVVGQPWLTAIAATFGQKLVDQSKYIAIAQPLEDGTYNFLILYQISPQRPCWSESGSQPVVIDPLLLNFDFTGICGRSTSSNDYSLRINGRDLGQDYGLSLEQRQGEVVLLGDPRPGSNYSQEVVIGRTRGLSSNLMEIQLEPGWNFARRTYNGQVLGHVYLTWDQNNSPLPTSPMAPMSPSLPSEILPKNPE